MDSGNLKAEAAKAVIRRGVKEADKFNLPALYVTHNNCKLYLSENRNPTAVHHNCFHEQKEKKYGA